MKYQIACAALALMSSAPAFAQEDPEELSENALVRLSRKFLRITDEFDHVEPEPVTVVLGIAELES